MTETDLTALRDEMRDTRSRWQHSYGSLDVVYADKLGEVLVFLLHKQSPRTLRPNDARTKAAQ